MLAISRLHITFTAMGLRKNGVAILLEKLERPIRKSNLWHMISREKSSPLSMANSSCIYPKQPAGILTEFPLKTASGTNQRWPAKEFSWGKIISYERIVFERNHLSPTQHLTSSSRNNNNRYPFAPDKLQFHRVVSTNFRKPYHENHTK